MVTGSKTVHLQRPEIDFERGWKQLSFGIHKLLKIMRTGIKKPFSYSEYSALYANVYNLCTQKVNTGKIEASATEILYDRYAKSISSYLQEYVIPSLRDKQGNTLLMEAVTRWRTHQIVVKWMMKLFNYLDRYYTKHNNRDSLKEVGLKHYQVLVYDTIKDDVARALLDKILAERNSEVIDRLVMKDGVQLFIEMGLGTLNAYEKDFEAKLILETSDFYKRESSKWITQDSCPVYLIKAEKRLDEEHNRAKSYLHETSEGHVISTTQAQLITNHQMELLNKENSGLIVLLENHRVEDLSRMFNLFARVKGLKPMANIVREYLTKKGKAIVEKHEERKEIDCKSYIEELLDMHEKYSALVTVHFEKHNLFLDALKDAFTSFVNKKTKEYQRANRGNSIIHRRTPFDVL